MGSLLSKWGKVFVVVVVAVAGLLTAGCVGPLLNTKVGKVMDAVGFVEVLVFVVFMGLLIHGVASLLSKLGNVFFAVAVVDDVVVVIVVARLLIADCVELSLMGFGGVTELLTSNCVGSLLNIVVEMVLTFEFSSIDFVDVSVFVDIVVVDVGLLKSDCAGSLLNIVVEIVIAFELSKIEFVDIGVFFVVFVAVG